jgi:multidrug efflux pump subunit AcrA (membrane-fusion protein)
VSLDRTRKTLVAAKSHVAAEPGRRAGPLRFARSRKVNSLQKAYDLVHLGPRQEEIDSMRGQVEQAKGRWRYAETNLANTVIRAPVTGTILERAVEIGEFVTTSFVGDRGAKGYVVSLADLNDLEVELDISQNDFAKLHMRKTGSSRPTLSRSQIRWLHQRGFARGQSPEGHGAGEGEGGASRRLFAARDECQRGLSFR